MTTFEIKGNVCFVCGKNKSDSNHHGIPVVLNPIHNVVIPTCRECHDKINRIDIGALTSYSYKMLKELNYAKKGVFDILGIIKNSKK